MVFLALALSSVGAGCAAPPPGSTELPFPPWQSEHDVGHPLVGVVWNQKEERLVAPAAMVKAMAAAPFVIIGEKHDNPDQHKLEAWLVGNLIASGRRPAVAFEMLTVDQTPAIAAYLDANPRDTTRLGEAVDWARRGWPAWEHYQPISQVSVEAGLSIVAADLRQETVKDIGRRGVDALGDEIVSQLRLNRPLPPDIRSPMMDEMAKSHCNMLPAGVAEKMVEVQRARDAHMAMRMVEAARAPGLDGAVLVAGFGHARKDWGVPSHLREIAPAGRVVSVALMEVHSDAIDPNAYGDMLGVGSLPFDFVWFTPRYDDEDPCAKFKKQLERLGK